ncbi:hypothetical protein [Paenibacillus contaminans]|uniref:hypothetical protein n=1 Tax=Paenibacillus contaminans TaxID=450362 RepID=UPI001314FF4C|nr:hypothetical protein [Paenibacillus contaminans]
MTLIDVPDKGYIRLVNHMGYAILDMMKTLVPVTAEFHWNGKNREPLKLPVFLT